jgi:hypothetical protein
MLHVPRLQLYAFYMHLIHDQYHLHTLTESESESYVTTDGQSASLSWNKTPIWGLRPDFFLLSDSCGSVLSHERTGLSIAIAADPRQRSHSRVRVPWDSRPYFTVSDSRLSFSSSATTRRAMVDDCFQC